MELKTKPCKKCGHAEATIEYVPNTYIEKRAYGGESAKIKFTEGDYINATCDRCGYTWRVDPLDKEKST